MFCLGLGNGTDSASFRHRMTRAYVMEPSLVPTIIGPWLSLLALNAVIFYIKRIRRR